MLPSVAVQTKMRAVAYTRSTMDVTHLAEQTRILAHKLARAGSSPDPAPATSAPGDMAPLPADMRVLVQRFMAPLLDENSRLLDRIREQAEELGRLRERLQQYEQQRAAGADDHALARGLRILLQALAMPDA